MDSRRAKRNHLPVYRWSRYAAAAILLIGALIYLGVQQGVIPGNQIVKNETPIVPGGNKALLILEDGTQMALEQLNVGEVAHQNDVHIDKPREGELTYAESEAGSPRVVSYHTISTPRGGQYQVNLSDGTKVWLNAASSIRFPTAFNAAERVVEIEGEVYFDVQHQDSKPFVVIANDQRITVLGTRFNVMAYPDRLEEHTAGTP